MTKNLLIIIIGGLLIHVVIVLFFLWQYNFNSIGDLSCSGDWSYDVKCPFGTVCVESGHALEGGTCKSWIKLIAR